MMELSITLQNRIIDFLKSLPILDDTRSRKAFIYSAGLDPQLQTQIPVDEPLAQFAPLLVSTLIKYGNLSDGRHALESVLEATQNYVGEDRKVYSNMLIEEIREYIREIKNNHLLHEKRFLDAAMPQQALIAQETELVTMIRLPDSEGLRKILEEVEEFQAQIEDIRTKEFTLVFPLDKNGDATFIDLWIGIKTSDFMLLEPRKKIRVYPSKDSDYYTFPLVPQKTGRLTLLVQVCLAETLLAEGLFKVSVSSKLKEGVQVIKTLISLPLGTFAITNKTKSSTKVGIANSTTLPGVQLAAKDKKPVWIPWGRIDKKKFVHIAQSQEAQIRGDYKGAYDALHYIWERIEIDDKYREGSFQATFLNNLAVCAYYNGLYAEAHALITQAMQRAPIQIIEIRSTIHNNLQLISLLQ